MTNILQESSFDRVLGCGAGTLQQVLGVGRSCTQRDHTVSTGIERGLTHFAPWLMAVFPWHVTMTSLGS